MGVETFSEQDGFVPMNMLCVPIFNGQHDVIGVAQLINKVGRMHIANVHAMNALNRPNSLPLFTDARQVERVRHHAARGLRDLLRHRHPQHQDVRGRV
jgi:hypothetical protein